MLIGAAFSEGYETKENRSSRKCCSRCSRPQAAEPPSSRLSNAHGCAATALTHTRDMSQGTSRPSETTSTPSAEPFAAASMGFAAIGAPVSDEQQDGRHDAPMSAEQSA